MLKMLRFDSHYCLYKTQYPVAHHLHCYACSHSSGDKFDERERDKEEQDVEEVPEEHHHLADNDPVNQQSNPYRPDSLSFIVVPSGQAMT